MITKCTDLILARRKFSQFADADLNDPNLTIVGFQSFDGELENVQINLKEMLDLYHANLQKQAQIIHGLGVGCVYSDPGEPNAVRTFTCPSCKENIVDFDYSLTGDFIQIDAISSDLWHKVTVGDKTEAHLHITFSNFPLGKTATILLNNPLSNVGEVDEVKVVLHGIGPDEKIRIFGEEGCPWCRGEHIMFEANLGEKNDENEDFIIRVVQTWGKDYDTPVKVSRFLTDPYITPNRKPDGGTH